MPEAVTTTTGTTTTSANLAVELRYFAAARAALGRAGETLDVAPGSTVRDVVEHIAAATPAAARVLGRCATLLDGRRVDAGVALHDGARLDLLPPFAGG